MSVVRVQCPWCSKAIATYSPAGGDGSGSILRWHINLNTRVRCDGTKADVTDKVNRGEIYDFTYTDSVTLEKVTYQVGEPG